jgi:MFS family permease
VRTGIDIVRRTDTLRRAFVLAALLNLAAWPVLSVLPAVAHDIDARAHALGLLTGAFYAGAAAVSFVVARLRRRMAYGSILFWGFFGAGVLLCLNAALTAWRAPGYDAVVVAGLTLIPIGLAIALDSSLLQALVQLGTRKEDQAPVLVVYATVTTIVTPIGGLAIGVIADQLSLWGALGVCGGLILVLTLVLRKRLTVFDELGHAPDAGGPAIHHPHLGLMHLFGTDVPGALGTLFHPAHHDDQPATGEPATGEPATGEPAITGSSSVAAPRPAPPAGADVPVASAPGRPHR